MRLTKIVIGCKINKYDIVNSDSLQKTERHFFMKRKKITAITLMLAAVAVTATVGGAKLGNNTRAAAAAETYALSDVFYVSGSDVLGAETVGEEKVTAFTLAEDEEVMIKRSLALKWYKEDSENKGKGVAEYFTLKFAFKDVNFSKAEISMDTKSAWATEEEKATNTVSFEKTADGNLDVKLNGENTNVQIDAADVTKDLTLTLADSKNYGEFAAKLFIGEAKHDLGSFKNVGANYAEYNYSDKAYPLAFRAELPTDAEEGKDETVILLKEINGQSFTGVTDDNKVTDDAPPVLVVNEELDGFLYGTAFALDYTVLDVLKSSSLSKTLQFYQYDPSLKEGDEGYKDYRTLSTSTYFMNTTYYVDKDGNIVDKDAAGAIATTVMEQEVKAGNEAREFVSVRIKVGDSTFNTDDTKPVYDLAWYANAGRTVEKDGVNYLIVDKNEEGAKYNETWITTSGTENVFDKEAFEKSEEYIGFDKALKKAAEEVYAGSNSYIYFPSFEWLIGDNNGYRNLKFTISYKTPSSTSASASSSLSYSALKLSVSQAGTYEFKIFANDKAGNTMKYYVDGELVPVTTSNVWDIEEIPSFTFEIENKGLKIKDDDSASDRKDTKVLNKTYSMDSISVIGASNLQQDFALYKVDLDKYNKDVESSKKIARSALSTITYADLAEAVKLNEVENGDYFDLYLNAYVSLLAGKNADDATKAKVKACFTQIKEEADCATEAEWNASKKYEWSSSSQSFETVESGAYLILADYWEKDLSVLQRVTAYKVVIVESEADVIEGSSDWLKNNVVSVVLFSIAGVMLILIVILLLVKPSDEKLEDVGAEEAAKKTSKKKEK